MEEVLMGIIDLHIGIVGAGGFSSFAAEAFSKVPGVKLVAVTDINREAAENMGRQLGLEVLDEFQQLLSSDHVNLIYIATPPFLHFAQSKMALMAGKHVICEKPAALKTSEAEELSLLASKSRLLYVINLMQRYNPLFEMVKQIVGEKILGNFLHGFFENYASSESLGPDHWFWDESKSGGIFIEHGVHFFDLLEGWLGEGKLVSSLLLRGPGIKKQVIDRVQAIVLYPGGAFNFYHGFDQSKMLDRQELRLQFEWGDLTLFEWIPVKMRLTGLLKPDQLERLEEITGGYQTIFREHCIRGDRREEHVILGYENKLGKQFLYQEMLKSMIIDQLRWIRDPRHARVMNAQNGVRSLQMAEDASRMAQIL
jgi:predicted dehydrogenase